MRKIYILPLIVLILIAGGVVLKKNNVKAQSGSETGPCTGSAAGRCRLETQTIFMNPYVGNKLQWVITTDSGKEFIYIHEPIPGPTNGWAFSSTTDLTTVRNGLFSQANGPCAGKAAGTCRFDTQTIFMNPYVGNKLQWVITTDSGREYSYVHEPSTGWGFHAGDDLTTVRNGLFSQANGPCFGKSAGTCRFDSQTIFANPYNANKLQWMITTDSGQEFIYDHEPIPGPTNGWAFRSTTDLTTVRNGLFGPVYACRDTFNVVPTTTTTPTPTPPISETPTPTPPDCQQCQYQVDLVWGPVIYSYAGLVETGKPVYSWLRMIDARIDAPWTEDASGFPACSLVQLEPSPVVLPYMPEKCKKKIESGPRQGRSAYLSGSIDTSHAKLPDGYFTASVENSSNDPDCTYEINLVSYKAIWGNDPERLWEDIEKQNVFDVDTVQLGPGQSASLKVKAPMDNDSPACHSS